MKNFLLATSALIVMAAVHPARAADQSAVPHLPTKTPIVPPAPIYNWTGCYIGAQGGGGAISDTYVATAFGSENFLHGGGGFAAARSAAMFRTG
jgi:outer membrane immunogenic protein